MYHGILGVSEILMGSFERSSGDVGLRRRVRILPFLGTN